MEKADVWEFLTTYGWAILVIIVAIGALIYFQAFYEPPKMLLEKNQTMQERICSNLDNGTAVYYEVINSKTAVEKSLNMRVVNIYGNQTSPRFWDNQGVMCNVGIEACQPQYVFCMQMSMVVPVNYTEYEEWYNG